MLLYPNELYLTDVQYGVIHSLPTNGNNVSKASILARESYQEENVKK